jgi:metal-responsive CopG/Arc/MetJ family transcriptional regulator
MPQDLIEAVDTAAASCHMSRSQWVRQVLIATLGDNAPVVFQHAAVSAAS